MEYGFVVREYLDFKQTMPPRLGLKELRSYGVKELSQMPRWRYIKGVKELWSCGVVELRSYGVKELSQMPRWR